MAFSFSFGGVRADSKDIVTQKVTRPVIPPMTDRVAYVPNRVGEYYYRTDIGPQSIEVDIVIFEKDQTTLRNKFQDISRWLNPLNGQQQLVFDDEPNVYYWAVLTKDCDIEQLLAIGNVKLIFEVPDGISHSFTETMVDISMKAPATFTRSSTAYGQTTLGTLSGIVHFPPNNPRYENMLYGTKGLEIEEGTTNLFGVGQSQGASGPWPAIGTGVTAANTPAYRFIVGLRNVTLKVVTPGNPANSAEGIQGTGAGVAGSTSYTYSAYALGTGTIKLRTVENDGATTTTSSTTLQLLPDQYQRVSLTITTQAGTTSVTPQAITASIQATTFYITAFQFEQKKYSTSWQPGTVANARTEPSVKYIPGDNLLRGQQGTIDFFFTKVTKPSSFGVMFDWGAFSAGPTKDRISIQHGTAIGSGEKSIRFEISTTGTKQKFCTLTLSSALVIGKPYYVACKWFLNSSLSGYQKITLADLTNGVEYSQIVTSTIPPPQFTAASTITFGSPTNSSFKANCIYSDVRLSIIPRNDTQITDSWKNKKPLIKDEDSTIKFTFNNTLYGTQATNLGTATGYPEIRYYPAAALSTFWIDVYPGPKRFQVNGVASSSEFRISTTQYAVFRPSVSTAPNNALISIGSIFPVLTGDHYFITNNTGATIFMSYFPRFI